MKMKCLFRLQHKSRDSVPSIQAPTSSRQEVLTTTTKKSRQQAAFFFIPSPYLPPTPLNEHKM